MTRAKRLVLWGAGTPRTMRPCWTLHELGRAFLLGDAFTGADVLLTTCLDWAHFYSLPLADGLAEYRTRTTSRDAYRRAFEVNYRPAAG